MADLAKVLKRLADELEAEDKLEQTAAQEKARDERIERLEQQLAQASPAEKKDALDELDDDELELIARHREAKAAAEPAADDKDPAAEEPVRPRQRLVELDVPRIHAGPDEPEIVEYTDEHGKVKTRSGRKQGVPANYDVEEIDDDDGDD